MSPSGFTIIWQKLWKTNLGANIRFCIYRFTFQNHRYRYFAQSYNYTWLNERAIEIPIILRILNQTYTQNPDAQVLELGNVLSHYLPIHHQVVDKYEQATGVINQDIVSFEPNQKYDLIIGISTLEHIGWDEPKKDAKKIEATLQKLQSLLKPNGQAVLTFPIGYNPHLDTLLQKKSYFNKLNYLKRVSCDNRWLEINKPPSNTAYNQPFCNANVVGIGTLQTKNSGLLTYIPQTCLTNK